MVHVDQEARVRATRPAYAAATTGGAARGIVVPALGTGGSLEGTAILVEECYATEPLAALTTFCTGLGHMPCNLIGTRTIWEQSRLVGTIPPGLQE